MIDLKKFIGMQTIEDFENNSQLFNEYCSLPKIKSLITFLIGSEECGKTSLLLSYSCSYIEEKEMDNQKNTSQQESLSEYQVIFMCQREKMEGSFPLFFQNHISSEKTLSKIKIIYIKNYKNILEYFLAINLDASNYRNSLFIIDDFSSYFTPKKDDDLFIKILSLIQNEIFHLNSLALISAEKEKIPHESIYSQFVSSILQIKSCQNINQNEDKSKIHFQLTFFNQEIEISLFYCVDFKQKLCFWTNIYSKLIK
ncbi:hypothetical protein M0811_01170 [Anaeramoeba ignava]|uniref:Uncharacterized protein n=1 Tax=Anaeramoeba ignava TaxID=1746090 RepID=A0A9Q0LLE2_ANAIG|nr:hypothetical protein M0811_01170 [Anaeramoeba ignava]